MIHLMNLEDDDGTRSGILDSDYDNFLAAPTTKRIYDWDRRCYRTVTVRPAAKPPRVQPVAVEKLAEDVDALPTWARTSKWTRASPQVSLMREFLQEQREATVLELAAACGMGESLVRDVLKRNPETFIRVGKKDNNALWGLL